MRMYILVYRCMCMYLLVYLYVLQVNQFECECDPGYEGAYCQVNINECYSLPCENHAVCIDLINRYACECAPGYAGPTCHENIDECKSEPCLNKVL